MENFIVRAPTRADLCGGTLDLWPIHAILRGTKTINVGLSLFAHVHFNLERQTSLQVTLTAKDKSTVTFDSILSANEIKKLSPSLRFPCFVLCEYLRLHPGFPPLKLDIRIDTAAPIGSGLGGSSVLCVALVRGLSRVHGEFSEQGWQWEILDWVKDVEASYLKTPTGTQDYLGALFGGLRSYGYEFGKITQSSFSQTTYQELSQRLFIVFSGQMHDSGASNWQVYKRMIEGDKEVLKGFVRIKNLSEDLHEELLKVSVSWKRVGEILNQEWDARKSLFNVSTPKLTQIMNFLNQQAILGAKVCGAAAGGSIVVLADPDYKESVIAACEAAELNVLTAHCVDSGVEFI